MLHLGTHKSLHLHQTQYNHIRIRDWQCTKLQRQAGLHYQDLGLQLTEEHYIEEDRLLGLLGQGSQAQGC